MENHPHLEEFLLDNIGTGKTNSICPEKWHIDILTQGHELPKPNIITSNSSSDVNFYKEKKDEKKTKISSSISFIDAIVSNVDDMFHMYPPETKRDIRIHTKERLIDWVSLYARKFFGPSTSRSISACLRKNAISLSDVERFAEFVSFMFECPVLVVNKTIIWHGYDNKSREPFCELLIKEQGVFFKRL